MPKVCEVTGLGRSMIYQIESDKRFPERVKGFRPLPDRDTRHGARTADRVCEFGDINDRRLPTIAGRQPSKRGSDGVQRSQGWQQAAVSLLKVQCHL